MDRLQVPKNLNIDELIKQFPINTVKGFNDDKVHFVCQSIYRGMGTLDENYCHPEKANKYYVPLNSEVLGKAVGTTNYKGLMMWMESAGIIKADQSWLEGSVSQGYRFTDKYLFQDMEWRDVKNYRLQKIQLNDCFEHKTHFQKRVVGQLKKWFKTEKLKIKVDDALELVNKQLEHDIQAAGGELEKIHRAKLDADTNRRKISAIEGANYLYEQDGFGYRLHTSITQLPKDLRHLVTYNGNPLVEVDLCCSQLFFSNWLMAKRNWKRIKNRDSEEEKPKIWKRVHIMNKINTKQYEYCIMCLKTFENSHGRGVQKTFFQKNTMISDIYKTIVDKMDTQNFLRKFSTYVNKRNYVKKLLLEQLYASRTLVKHKGLYMGENKRVWDCFEILYPDEVRLFEAIKKANYKDLSMLLQRIEATAILGYVCKRLLKEYPEVPIFTLHDCLVTTVGNEQIIKEAMVTCIQDFMGFIPNLKIKKWDV